MTVLIPLALGGHKRSAGFQTADLSGLGRRERDCRSEAKGKARRAEQAGASEPIADFQIGWPCERRISREPRFIVPINDSRITENIQELVTFGVRCFLAFDFSANPHIPPLFTAFSPEIQLSPHSALMGGQFPKAKRCGAFKNPLFYAVAAVQTAPKKELSLSMVQKTVFFTVSVGLNIISRPDRVVWIR